MLTCKYLFDNSDLYLYENKKPNRLSKKVQIHMYIKLEKYTY